jgi:predicted amino acid-binding ACT domain protein
MEVLGDLICIPEEKGSDLPLPWWHRAPLGLSNDTRVFVALTVSNLDRPVPDLIVTVLDPNRWDRMYHLECFQEDRPGIVAQVFETVYPLNIALAETVKVEKDGLHHVSLICEPASDEQDVDVEVTRIQSQLRNIGFTVPEPQPRLQPLPKIVWHRAGQVEHGWVKGVDWKTEIKRRHSSVLHQIDLNRVVVSADTENRVLRFVFPRRGAMTVRIRHADEPGALADITKALQHCDLNILSALLRRGGGRGADAELVAVCEPTKGSHTSDIGPIQEKVEIQVSSIDQRFRPQPSVHEGLNAYDTIYSRHPEEIVARVPEGLSWAVQNLKRHLRSRMVGKKEVPIFLSRRFAEPSGAAMRVVDDVRHALELNGCFALEAEPTVGRDPNTIYTEVSSKMWVSKGGIILVVKETAEKPPLSLNLAHEWGFLLGQGKSVLVLVEDGIECWKVIQSFSNLAGVTVHGFNRHDPNDSRKSAYSVISSWIRFVRS